MQYFVIGPDGTKYGPASMDTLAQWVREGRVGPVTVLQDAATGARLAAQAVPGLGLGVAGEHLQQPFRTPSQPPGAWNQAPSMSPYPHRGTPLYGAVASGDVTKAFVFGAIGLACCPIIFSVIGIVFACKAMEKGHPTGQAALIFCIVTLVAGIVIGAFVGTVGGFG